jgi:ureidoacrylate peracid hydrolase
MHVIDIPEFALERGRMMRPNPRIEASKTVVLAIDFQRFFIDDGQPMGNVHSRDVLTNANRINTAVRDAGGLVVFTQHSVEAAPASPTRAEASEGPASVTLSAAELRPGSESYELHPEIVRGAGDITVVKHQSSPLHPGAVTGLHEILEERAIETVIITGLVTNGCCDCTARDAFQYGYDVFIATDATAAMTDAEHNGALLNLAIYYAEPVTTNAIEQAAKSAGG